MSAVSADALGTCHYLRTVAALPVHADSQGRIIATIGGNLRAITMPEYWGYRVRDRLSSWRITAPTMWHPIQRVTILTGAHDPTDLDDTALAAITATGARILDTGALLPLPGHSEVTGWSAPPRTATRPAMSTVLGALAAALAAQRQEVPWAHATRSA
ncbi:hypothetical protein [Nocardia puris]|uniref:Uncharacterized protein n=1 Tax=Nocardia puris TaxID=208602 RepID=A0A366CXV9_9NOCA|nr:hypothetical protein [Nocardia puris]RBO82049.1 hypothetical protein DFR74_1254 [Nocardia puris]